MMLSSLAVLVGGSGIMGRKKPDIFWILVVVVALGAATGSLVGDNAPLMAPQQAGIIVR